MSDLSGVNRPWDSGCTNFIEYIEKCIETGLLSKSLLDENNQNDTVKSDDIISYFHSDKIIRISATSKDYKDVTVIKLPEKIIISQ
jgi:type III restriction enzyme